MKTIWRIIKMAKPWRGAIIIAVFSLLVLSAISLVMPMIVRELLARLADDSITNSIVIILGCVLLGTYVLKIIFQFVNEHFSRIAGFNVVNRVRYTLYNHIQTLSPKWYMDKSTGQIVSRFSEDAYRFTQLIAHNLPDLFISILMFAGTLTMLFVINPLLAAFVCIPLPLIFLTSIIARKIRKNHIKVKAMIAEMLGDLTDNIQGMKEIQVFNRQEYEYNRIRTESTNVIKTSIRINRWRALINPLVSFMQGAGTITIIIAGGILALHGHIAAADITAFLLYVGMLYTPIANLARILEETQDSITSGKRIFEILDTQSDIVDAPNAIDVGVLKGDIEFRNVHFSYHQPEPDTTIPEETNNTVYDSAGNEIETMITLGDTTQTEPETLDVLKNISFTAPAGKMVALVGSTGAGKSTIASLMTRFFDVTKGAVTIDGTDIRDMTLESLRNNISIVLQDVFLFNGTIYENIAYGKPDATKEEVIAAARSAALHDFIKTLPNKYDTVVGERGTRLSGGQKQRVALARAILRQSPILILDEATSAVDNETESHIQDAIANITGSRTIIVIAHRLSTIERADEILFLEKGKILERGTHEQLLTQKGHYAKMQKVTQCP